jgi:hypothetical protein
VRGKIKAELVLFFVVVVVCLLAAEWFVGIVRPQMTMSTLLADSPRIFRESDILPYQLIPNAYSAHTTAEFSVPIRINSEGYRGPEFDPGSPRGFRVLVLGDSFTFGHGCTAEECYVGVLGSALEDSLGPGVTEVINAGYVSCYYPDSYYTYLVREGLELSPGLVVVGFFLGNDVDRQGLGFNDWLEVDDDGLPLRVASTVAHVENGYWVSNERQLRYRYPVLRNSQLFQLLVSATERVRHGGEGPYYNRLMYVPEYSERTEEAVERVKRLMSGMHRAASERGTRFVVLMIPDIEQVETRSFFGDEGPPPGLDLEKPQRIFRAFFEEQGIDYVDLLPTMRDASVGRSLYYPIDQHWTPEGNAVCGRWLAMELLRRGLVPRGTVPGP